MERIIFGEKTTKGKMVVAPVAPNSSLAIAPLPAQTKFLWTGKCEGIQRTTPQKTPRYLSNASLVFFSVFEEMFRIFSIESYLLVWNIPSSTKRNQVTLAPLSKMLRFVKPPCDSSPGWRKSQFRWGQFLLVHMVALYFLLAVHVISSP